MNLSENSISSRLLEKCEYSQHDDAGIITYDNNVYDNNVIYLHKDLGLPNRLWSFRTRVS